MTDAMQPEIAEIWELFKKTDAQIKATSAQIKETKVTGDDLVQIVNDDRFHPRDFGVS